MTDITTRRKSCIYGIRCNKTGRLYIGTTVDPETRMYEHLNHLKRGIKGRGGNDSLGGAIWQKDFDDFGEDAFEYFIIEDDVPFQNRFERESFYIELYRTKDPIFGYNAKISSKKYDNPLSFKPAEGSAEDSLIDTLQRRILCLTEENEDLKLRIEFIKKLLNSFLSELDQV